MRPLGIAWLAASDFERTLQEAGEGGKPVLLDFHDPTYPGCQELERSTYADPGVIAAVTEHVVPLRVVTKDPDSASRAIMPRYISISASTVQLIAAGGTACHSWRGAPRATRPAIGYRDVYHEVAGDLPPDRFLAQLLIGRGKLALTQARYAEAERLFETVLTEYETDELATDEARYWSAIASARCTAGEVPAGAL
jgi:hypothetical protein